ncbi:hypothetical protein ACSBR1_039590 [Camellia fascicularis]
MLNLDFDLHTVLRINYKARYSNGDSDMSWEDKILPIPARITRFNSLKQLELFVMVSSDLNLLSLTSLLNASPLLQKLHLSLHNGRSRGRRIE